MAPKVSAGLLALRCAATWISPRAQRPPIGAYAPAHMYASHACDHVVEAAAVQGDVIAHLRRLLSLADEHRALASIEFYTFGKTLGEGAYGKVKVSPGRLRRHSATCAGRAVISARFRSISLEL